MIGLQEALELIEGVTSVLEPIELSINESIQHVAAADIISPINVAPFRNSAMDGFAVATTALDNYPATLEIADTIYAGAAPSDTNDSKRALKIMTGGVVPDSYDAVIPFEDTTYDSKKVTVEKPVKVGQHIRLPGEDIVIGEKLMSEGTVISELMIGVLASIGLATVKVIRKPRVLVISTGDELVQPGASLSPGQLYDSNGPTVASIVRRHCSSVDRSASVVDECEALTDALKTDHDVVITTGGVSAGERDFVPEAAIRAGWQEIFHKVAIKPGKPIFVATRNNNQLLFGLPGNPLSTAVTCAVFVIPTLKKMLGLREWRLPLEKAHLDGEVFKNKRLVMWPGTLKIVDGQKVVRFSDKRSSAALSALIGSDGLIIQDARGDSVDSIVSFIKWSKILTY